MSMEAKISSDFRELKLQNCGTYCQTAWRRGMLRTILFFIWTSICIAVVILSYMHFQPAILTHPGFEAKAMSGEPDVGPEHGFSTLTVQEGYDIQICGVPAVDENNVFFYLTNPLGNTVWFRAEVLNAEGMVIGSTGVLKQGQHLPSIQLTEDIGSNSASVTVRIVGYEPNTWLSCGNVNLQIELKE